MDGALAYVTGHLISSTNQVNRMPGQFVNKTRNFHVRKNLLIEDGEVHLARFDTCALLFQKVEKIDI